MQTRRRDSPPPYRDIDEDPESRFDKLPQPYRFVARILDAFIETTWQEIERQKQAKIDAESKLRLRSSVLDAWRPHSTETDARNELNLGRNCVLRACGDGRHLVAAQETKLLVLDAIDDRIRAELPIENDDDERIGLVVAKFGEGMLLGHLTGSGSEENGKSGFLKLYCFYKDSLFELRDMTSQDSLTSVQKIELSPSGNFISIYQGGDSSTLAVYRLPVASWLSDVNAAIQQQELAEEEEETPGETSLTEKLTGKLAKPVIVLRTKPPELAKHPTTFGNPLEMAEAFASGRLERHGRLGEYHTMSESYLEERRKAAEKDQKPAPRNGRHLTHLPSCLFLNGEAASTESEMVLSWSHHNMVHWFPLQTQGKNEPLPSLSLPSIGMISTTCLSLDQRMLAIGYSNGFAAVYDKLFGSIVCRLVPAGDTGPVTSLAVFPWKEPVGIFQMASRTYCLVVGLENGSLWRAFFPNQSNTTGTAIFERDYDDFIVIRSLIHCPMYPSLIFAQHGSASVSVREVESGRGLCQFTLPNFATLSCITLVNESGRLFACGTGTPDDGDLAAQMTHHLYEISLESLPELDAYVNSSPSSREDDRNLLTALSGPGGLAIAEEAFEKKRSEERNKIDDYIAEKWESLAEEVRKLEEKRQKISQPHKR